MAIDLCDFSEHFRQNRPLKTLEIAFQSFLISKFSWGKNPGRPAKWLTQSALL